MKKINVLFIVFGLFFGSSSSVTANDDDNLSTLESTFNFGKRIVLDVTSFSTDEVKCKIIDQTGLIVFMDELNVASSGFKSFNLQNLPAGNYTFEVNDKLRMEKHNFILTSNRAIVNESPIITYKPVVQLNDDKSVDFHLFAQGKAVQVQLIGENGAQFYNRNYSDQTIISKRIKMNKVSQGTYTLKVTVEGEIFYHDLSI